MITHQKQTTMKKLILIPALLAFFAALAFAYPLEPPCQFAQAGWAGDDVPALVKTKFASLYPTVTRSRWSKEDANFEVNFELNEVETSVVFDAQGNVLETETEISVTALPKGVIDYCSKTFPGKKIKEAAKLMDGKGAVTYEAEIGGADQIFDAGGNFIRSAKE
jgi:hypothetical protein